jgi:D-aspartate ligase
MVVCGAGVNGLAYARSLGRRGIPIALLDVTDQPGLHSRFAAGARVPHPAREPRPCLEALLGLAATLADRPVLVATADLFLAFVARHRAALDAHYRVLAPAPATLAEVLNKKQQYERAQAAGIPLPRTCFPTSAAELEQALTALAFPCVIKPYTAHEGRQRIGGRKAVLVASPAESRAVYSQIGFDAPFMIQETVPGADDQLVGYLALWHEGRELVAMTKRKLRQSPPRFGDGSCQVGERNDAVAALAQRLLSAFDYHGLVGVEFKRDLRDGEYRLMEINARTVSCTQLAVSSGLDLPWLAYRLMTEGAQGLQAERWREGLTYVHEIWDVAAFRALRREGAISTGEWWRSYCSAGARALGAWDDPMPLLRSLWRSVAKARRSRRAPAAAP